MTPTISVIVPVYNVERYLARCIDSILAQTFMDFELILIDDGSPDNSGRICDEYAAKDARIRVFHQENGGVSSARNHGIDAALGEYVCFVDSDDLILPTYLETLFETITENDADIATCGYITSYYKNGQVIKQETREPAITGTYSNFGKPLIELQSPAMYSTPFNHLFRKEIIKASNITFPPIRRGEDDYFVHCFLRAAQSIAICAENLYIYIIYLSDRTSATSNFTANYYNCYSLTYNNKKLLCEQLREYDPKSAKTLDFMFRKQFWSLLCGDFVIQMCRGPLTYKGRLNYIKTCLSASNPPHEDIAFSGKVDRLIFGLVKKKACHRLVWLGYMRSCLRK